MHPFMIRTDLPWIGALDVPSYFLMIILAFLVASSLGVRDARRAGQRTIDYLDLSLVLLVVGMAGARLAFVFLASPQIVLDVPKQPDGGWEHFFCRMAGESHLVTRPWNLGRYYLLHPQAVFAVWNGGFVFYGGMLAVVPAGWWFCKRRAIDFWTAADLAAPPGAAALAIGRVGCLFSSCCHGGRVEGSLASWGVVFHRGVPEALQGVPLWPTQISESIVALGLCWGLYAMARAKRFDGQIFIALLAAYGIWRPINEIFRADDQRGSYFGFSTSQWISLFMVMTALALLPLLLKRRRIPSAAAPSSSTGQVAEAGA